MKGWVYVITNKAMPGLVKVGYSTKDPELRAEELNHTGSPHPYLVEYELLIDEPYQVEQQTHKLLSAKREAKEWFRCTPEEAVAAIKQIAGNRTITETYKRVERAKAEALHQQELREREAQLKRQQAEQEQELREREAQLKRQQAEQEIENRLLSEESAIRQKYQQQFEARFPTRPFWNYWIGGSILALIGISMMLQKALNGGAFMLAAIGGTILGAFLQNYFEKERKQSTEYLSLEKQRDAELEAVRARVVSCQECGQQIRFNRAELLLSKPGLFWSCPSCKAIICMDASSVKQQIADREIQEQREDEWPVSALVTITFILIVVVITVVVIIGAAPKNNFSNMQSSETTLPAVVNIAPQPQPQVAPSPRVDEQENRIKHDKAIYAPRPRVEEPVKERCQIKPVMTDHEIDICRRS